MNTKDIFDSELTKAEPICVGVLWCGDEEHSTKIYQDPTGNFTNSDKELQDWAFALNNPWSDTSTYYEVHPNYHFPGEWIAERTIIVYDDIEVHIAARADSPQDAIVECDKFMAEVIAKYAPKDEDNDE
jgi:hypothetical protein